MDFFIKIDYVNTKKHVPIEKLKTLQIALLTQDGHINGQTVSGSVCAKTDGEA